MGETTVKYLGHYEGHMISKLEENLGDTDIKNFTVSPLYQIKCTPFGVTYSFSSLEPSLVPSQGVYHGDAGAVDLISVNYGIIPIRGDVPSGGGESCHHQFINNIIRGESVSVVSESTSILE